MVWIYNYTFCCNVRSGTTLATFRTKYSVLFRERCPHFVDLYQKKMMHLTLFGIQNRGAPLHKDC